MPWRGPDGAKIAVVGEAPGPQEDELGKPFVGAAGKNAEKWFNKVGIDLEDLTWLNVVSCFPNNDGKIRAPNQNEIDACRKNLLDQLTQINPSYIIIFGKVALNAIYPLISLSQIRLKPFLFPYKINDQSITSYATYHPSAGLRNPSYNQSAIEDLQFFTDAIYEKPLFFTRYCIVCNKEAENWVNLLPYCLSHIPKEK